MIYQVGGVGGVKCLPLRNGLGGGPEREEWVNNDTRVKDGTGITVTGGLGITRYGP